MTRTVDTDSSPEEKMKTGIRLKKENRILIDPIGFSIAIRFSKYNRGSIFPERFLIGIVIAIEI
jgi:hypothetical protein